jgi:calcineurin-like phosphoesterase family protein
MTHKSFVTSDTHFGHKNILTFTDDEGKLTREFDSVEEMDEHMVDNWNRIVRPVDKVYHLGDVAIQKKSISIVERLNGKKILIKGNHDIFSLKEYAKYFKDVRAYRMFPGEGFILSHIPIHPRQLQGRWRYNIHGHLHQNLVGDERYINVCVEQTDYEPVDLEHIFAIYGINK